MNSLKVFLAWFARTMILLAPLAVLVVAILALCNICFGGTTRKPARYKVAPTNCVVRVNGTNCWVRYMKDNLLNTNLVIMCEPFDPPPAVEENNEVIDINNEEVGDE